MHKLFLALVAAIFVSAAAAEDNTTTPPISGQSIRSSDSLTQRSEQPLYRCESRPSLRLRNKGHFVQELQGSLNDSLSLCPAE